MRNSVTKPYHVHDIGHNITFRLSENVLQACTETGSLLKIDVPENRRPWFA